MPNYANSKIYKIESLIGDIVYYGSTTQQLSKRMAEHRYLFKKGTKKNTSKQVFEFGDAKIFLVEAFPCENTEQLFAKEGEYVRNNRCVNKMIPNRTQKEYDDLHRVRINSWKRERVDCVCGVSFTRTGRSNHVKTERHRFVCFV